MDVSIATAEAPSFQAALRSSLAKGAGVNSDQVELMFQTSQLRRLVLLRRLANVEITFRIALQTLEQHKLVLTNVERQSFATGLKDDISANLRQSKKAVLQMIREVEEMDAVIVSQVSAAYLDDAEDGTVIGSDKSSVTFGSDTSRTDPESATTGSSDTPIIAGAAAGVVVLLAVVGGLWYSGTCSSKSGANRSEGKISTFGSRSPHPTQLGDIARALEGAVTVPCQSEDRYPAPVIVGKEYNC